MWSRCTGAALSVGLLLALAPTAADALSTQQQGFLSLAQRGVDRAQSTWADRRQTIFIRGRNVPISWYDERLNDHGRYPLATIWGAVPLFESLTALQIAQPSPAHRAAVISFAIGPGARRARAASVLSIYGAEGYYSAALQAYAPYPDDRGRLNVWCDDNAWWGLAFFDAYLATGITRFLGDAQRAFTFIVRDCWDPAHGGMWWNTFHTPGGQKAGEPLAAGALLGALLAQALSGKAVTAAAPQTAASDMQHSEKFLAWADAHFTDPGTGLYARTGDDSTPTPYIAGTQIEAEQVLCQLAGEPYCTHAAQLADAAYQRFADRLNMGPQFDAIYLHWMLVYGKQTNDPRWAALALEMANQARDKARDPRTGLYLRAWDGSAMSGHQADPNMLRTHAATVELFAWLAADGP